MVSILKIKIKNFNPKISKNQKNSNINNVQCTSIIVNILILTVLILYRRLLNFRKFEGGQFFRLYEVARNYYYVLYCKLLETYNIQH
jgi:hypothetical protein